MSTVKTMDDVKQLSIGDFVRRQARLYASRPLATFENGHVLTYESADLLSEHFACGLVALGLPPGSRIGIMMENSPECLIAAFGVAKAGMEEVPLHASQKGAGLAHIVQAAGIRTVILDAAFSERFTAILDQLPELRLFVLSGQPVPNIPAPTMAFDELLRSSFRQLPQVSAFQTSTIMFTSGTTGRPKGVVRSHRADILTGLRANQAMAYGRDDVIFNVFPLAHINAKCNTLLGAMHGGGSVVVYKKFSASGFWESTRRHGVTSASFQGAMLGILWKTRQVADRDNPVMSGRAAPVPSALHREFEAFFGLKLFETYGSTETGIVAVNRERRPGSFGKVMDAYFEAAVLDENDEPVPDGQPGLFAIRPKLPGVIFNGYLDMADYTLSVFRNLWHHTGDLVVREADGYLSFVSRDSKTIRRRGENITPWEVEQAIGELPGVFECAAYGVPSELGEEEVMVAIVRNLQFEPIEASAIIAHCEARLPRYAVPHFLRFVEAIPRNESQKAMTDGLKTEGVTPDTWQRPSNV